MTYFRHAAMALALLSGTSAASAQAVITTQPVETRTVVTTQPTLVLTPEQRHFIYRDIAREHVAPAPPTVTYTVGTRVPPHVHLYTVPESVAVAVPAVRACRYMMVNGHVVLVDPATSEVVAELD